MRPGRPSSGADPLSLSPKRSVFKPPWRAKQIGAILKPYKEDAVIEWITAIISPIVGAGAGSVFSKFFNKKPRPGKEKTASTPASLGRQLEELEEWRDDAQELMLSQEREIRKLRSDVGALRLLVDVFLILLFLALGGWYLARL